MNEYRFKVLKEGQRLCGFSENEMVVYDKSGEYYFYKVDGILNGKPEFYKGYETASVFNPEDISEAVVVFKRGEEYYVYKIEDSSEGLPELNDEFCIVVKRGIGKVEHYNTKTRVRCSLPAKEKENGR